MMEGWVVPRALRERAEGPDGDRPFLRAAIGGSTTYAESYAHARRMGAVLASCGVEPGDRVVTMAPNSAEAVHTWLGANLIGAVDVTINTAYRGGSLEHALNNSAARVMCIDERLLPVLAESEARVPALELVLVYVRGAGDWPAFRRLTVRRADEVEAPAEPPDRAVSPRDVASVIYTSGTTGPAKGVLMPHAQTHVLARMTAEQMRMGPDDVFYCVHPLYHVGGKFMAVYATVVGGGVVALEAGFSPPDWLAGVREHGATLTLMHGPMLEMVHREAPDDAGNPLTRVLAVPLPSRIGEDFERRFGVRAIETWGMTEINAPCWRPYDEELRLGSCGRVLDDLYELRIVDPATDEPVPAGETGEIVVRPRVPWTTMQGYQGMAEATTETWRNLWFHSGDLGRIDADGYVYFSERVKERIRRRGENISSYEIEAAAATHPAIRESAAVGVPSGFEDDDDVKLCVVAEPGAALAPVEVLDHLVHRVPHYMVPRYVELMETLPRTPTNKVQKAMLRTVGVNESTWDRKAAGVSLSELRKGRGWPEPH